MKDIKVSIIVAVYNGAATLSRCLDSVFLQTWKNIEVICVNDCSSDNSLGILKEYASLYSNMRIINHIENKNGGGADNTGIKAATGEYVCIVDQDDTLYLDAIEQLISNSHLGNDDIVIGQWCTVNINRTKERQQNGVIGNDLDANIRHNLTYGMRVLGGLFKPELFIKNNLFYPEKVSFADNAIYAAILISAKSISIIDAMVYDYYLDNLNSLSKIVSKRGIKDRIYTTDLFYENCMRMDVDRVYVDAIRCRYLDLTTYTIVLLGYYPIHEVSDMIEYVCNKIGIYWSNEYRSRFTEEEVNMLMNPMNYIKKEKTKRRRKRIKIFFHSIRHSIVVLVKQMLGMNPNKSLLK